MIGESGNRGRGTTIMEIELDAGVHELEFLHWEAGSGAGVSLLIYRGRGEAPDFAFTAAREPETNPLQPYWELLGAFGGRSVPFVFTNVAYSPGGNPKVDLTWASQPGESFTIEKSPNLADWDEVTDGVAAGDGADTTFQIELTGRAESELYFRAVKEQ